MRSQQGDALCPNHPRVTGVDIPGLAFTIRSEAVCRSAYDIEPFLSVFGKVDAASVCILDEPHTA